MHGKVSNAVGYYSGSPPQDSIVFFSSLADASITDT